MEINSENNQTVSFNQNTEKRSVSSNDRQIEALSFNIIDFFEVLLKRLWIIILVGAMVTVGIYYRDKKNYTPRYTSTATLYMLFENQVSDNASYAYNFAKALIGDIQYCIISSPTAKITYDRLKDYNISYNEIYGSVSTENPEDTRYVLVTSVASSPEKAKLIVNTICQVCKEKMKEDTGDEVVNISAPGEEVNTPINAVSINRGLKYGLISSALLLAVFYVLRMFDDRFRDEYDMEKTLNVTLLGSIPDANSAVSGKYSRYGKRRRKYKYGGKYGYGYGYGYTYGYGSAYGGRERTSLTKTADKKMKKKNKKTHDKNSVDSEAQ